MFWLILGILFVIFTICLGIAIIHESDEKIGVIISYVGFIIGLLLIIGYINNRPKAIDVYKGETTLEITYKDGIPIDSVVVWKNNK